MDKLSNNSLNSQEGISIKEYVNDKFLNLEKAIDVRFDSVTQATNSALQSADKAITKSDLAVEKRLDSVNEFRAVLTSQQATFSTRVETDLMNKSIVDRLDKLENKLVVSEGKGMGTNQTLAWVITGISILISITMFIISFFE